MRNVAVRWALGPYFLLLALLAGCGANTAVVKGRITYKGAPLDYGSVVFFVGKDGIPGQISPDGTYQAKGVPFGEAKVEVHSRAAEESLPAKHTKGGKEGPAVERKGMVIPENYNDKEKSGLRVTIQKSVTEYDIELKDPE